MFACLKLAEHLGKAWRRSNQGGVFMAFTGGLFCMGIYCNQQSGHDLSMQMEPSLQTLNHSTASFWQRAEMLLWCFAWMA